jgi:cysteine desulfurase
MARKLRLVSDLIEWTVKHFFPWIVSPVSTIKVDRGKVNTILNWTKLPVQFSSGECVMRVENSIYLDYQSTTPVDDRVMQAMLPYFTDSFGNPHSSSHSLGWKSSDAVETARAVIASTVGALPEEIVFTSGATESNNQAMFGVMFGNTTPRNRVLVSAIEHKCVKESALFFGNKLGFVVEEIPVLSTGKIDLQAYESMLSDDVLLVSIMAVNNEIGVIQDISHLSDLAHQAGALFHCDAAQALEAMDVDVADLGVDLLSLSAHKLYGPKGIGALYIDSSIQDNFPALIHGGGQQWGLRAGTLPTPLCVGFGVAASLIQSEGVQHRSALRVLSDRFIERLLSEEVRFRLNGDQHDRHPGNLSIELIGIDAESLLMSLQPRICAATGSACNSGMIQSSYVLRAIGVSEGSAASCVRFSLGRFSDEAQVDEAVKIIANGVRSGSI